MSVLKLAVSEKDHIQGVKSATIEIVEYGDYQCQHCGNAYFIIKEIQETFGDQIKFVFRNFPLKEIHEFAWQAALYAEAADLQGKFWEMHDGIYENQNRISEKLFDELATKVGLDIDKFHVDISSAVVKEKIDYDFESGVRSGVNGTPSFYVNGNKFDGSATDLYQMLKESSS